MRALIITEKETTYHNFEKALGGVTGTYNGIGAHSWSLAKA